jgi:shikimate dehydrogenase
MTKPYAEVIGDPIAHSKSPMIHNFWLEKLGIDADYRACHVRPNELADYFTARRADPDWRGCNVTIPHKQSVRPFLDRVDDKACAIGAVNCVFRSSEGTLFGTNTDVDGVEDALAGLDLEGQEVCVMGGGGAARSAFFVLAAKNCGSVFVLARDPDKAVKAANECGLFGVPVLMEPDSVAFCEAALLVNATQLGMTGQQMMPGYVLSQLDELAEGAAVFDMVYAPLETDLLAAARRKGFRTVDGLVMLIGQAARAFEFFFGQPAPRHYDPELRELLLR